MSSANNSPVTSNANARENPENALTSNGNGDTFDPASKPRIVSNTSASSGESFDEDKDEQMESAGHMFAESSTNANALSCTPSGTTSTVNSRRIYVSELAPSTGAHDSQEDSSFVSADNNDNVAAACWQDVSYRVDTSKELGLVVDTSNYEVLQVEKGKQADEMGIIPQSILTSLNGKLITSDQPFGELWAEAGGKKVSLAVRRPREENIPIRDNGVNGTAGSRMSGAHAKCNSRVAKNPGGARPVSCLRYRGYSKVTGQNRWRAYFRVDGKQFSAGDNYNTEEQAARASEAAKEFLKQNSLSSCGATSHIEFAKTVRGVSLAAVQNMKEETNHSSNTAFDIGGSTRYKSDAIDSDKGDSRKADSSFSLQATGGPATSTNEVHPCMENNGEPPPELEDYRDKLKKIRLVTYTREKQVGTRGYAQWEKDAAAGWHWGIITDKKYFKASGRGQYKYDVLFDDGDFKEGLVGEQVWTAPCYRDIFKMEPPPLPEHVKACLDSRCVGEATASDRETDTKEMRRKAYVVSIKEALTPQQLFRERCTACLLCLKADCQFCATCVRNRDRPSEAAKEVCLQKMCCKMELHQKAQPAAGFPKNWYFAFGPPREGATNRDSPLAGLFLITPRGRVYRSLKAASRKNHQGKELSQYPRLAEEFHKHVGIPYDPDQADDDSHATDCNTGVEPGGKRNREDTTPPSHVQKRQRLDGNLSMPLSVIAPALTPNDLFRLACKECQLCRKADCLKCATCIRNKSREGEEAMEVCLRKMCITIEEPRKAQVAVGFPNGWRFTFDLPKRGWSLQAKRDQYPAVEGLVLLHPSNGRKYHAVERAMSHNPRMFKGYPDVIKDFYAHVGATYSETDLHLDLVGRGFCQEWTDVEGRNQVVYGTIVAGCEADPRDDDILLSKVEYTEESRSDTNDIPSVVESVVPKSQSIPYALALGACVSYAESVHRHDLSAMPKIANLPLAWRWLVPQRRREELLDTGLGVQLPRLTLTLHGFRLVFTAKESTIPNAGYGVFVSATPLVKNEDGGEDFKLNVGEFLDMGVYAPFQMQDRKKECIFFLKNYVHNFKCEEWCFNTKNEDFEFDITDDLTGNVNESARRHIPSYVNECSAHDIATVRAEHDPSGNVHYLLGVVDGEGLVLPGNGSETEIFINYGPKYEPVRIRKGYSDLPPDIKAKKLEEMEKEEEEYLDEIDGFTVDQVGSCVDFLRGLFMKDGKPDLSAADRFSHRAGRRAMRVSLLFEERAKALKDLGEPVPPALLDSAKSLSSLVERLFGKGGVKDRRREEIRCIEAAKVCSS